MTAPGAPERKRYRQLIDSAQATQTLWIAESAERALILANEKGEPLILVWPSAEIARAALAPHPNLAVYQPVQRTLERWLGTSTPHLVEDGVLVAANPDATFTCLRVPAADFARDLADVPVLQGTDLARLRSKLARRRTRGEGD